jgi:hypothetical protein
LSFDRFNVLADSFITVNDAIDAHAELNTGILRDDLIPILIDFAFVSADACRQTTMI